jgi:hypothetical protein
VERFKFVLALIDGEPADPGMFLTAIPDWRVGDTFLAGSELQRFRILAIAANEDEATLDLWLAA